MSRRPHAWTVGEGMDRMVPGGALWSEAPVRGPRQRVRRTGVPAVVVACAAEHQGWARTAFGPTYAEYTGRFGFVSLTVRAFYDATATGPISLRVASITPDPADPPGGDNTPTTPVTITGPELAGEATMYDVAGAGTITGVRMEWDAPGAFTGICIETYSAS